MSKNKIVPLILIIFLSSLFSLGFAADAFAYKGKKFHRRHHPYYGRIVTLPELLVKIIVHAGKDYYYHHGYFYKRMPRGYVIIDPPIGAIVKTLPPERKVIVLNGKRYFYCNDTYFRKKNRGYIVVDDPVYQVVELPKEAKIIEAVPQRSEVSTSVMNEGYTVNIPNENGSYTPVLLAKSGEGYLGPQGEYYPEFPSVKQLKAMYGQK